MNDRNESSRGERPMPSHSDDRNESSQPPAAQQIEIKAGNRLVIASRNDETYPWSSRLYVNGGETATLTSAKHKSEAGVRRWAERVLAS
jgi:hypothetical protein